MGRSDAVLLNTIVGGRQDRSEVVRDLLASHYAETEGIAKRNAAILEQILENHPNARSRGTAWGN
jgi:hypothetical protein